MSGRLKLLHTLLDISNFEIPDNELGSVTEKLRAGLLYRGSTSEESIKHASNVKWGNTNDYDGRTRQGIVSQFSNHSLSDVFEEMIEVQEIKQHLQKKFPGIRNEEIEAFYWAIWAIISSFQMFESLKEVELQFDPASINESIQKMKKIYDIMIDELAD